MDNLWRVNLECPWIRKHVPPLSLYMLGKNYDNLNCLLMGAMTQNLEHFDTTYIRTRAYASVVNP